MAFLFDRIRTHIHVDTFVEIFLARALKRDKEMERKGTNVWIHAFVDSSNKHMLKSFVLSFKLFLWIGSNLLFIYAVECEVYLACVRVCLFEGKFSYEDFCNKIWKMANKYEYTESHIWIIWQNGRSYNTLMHAHTLTLVLTRFFFFYEGIRLDYFASEKKNLKINRSKEEKKRKNRYHLCLWCSNFDTNTHKCIYSKYRMNVEKSPPFVFCSYFPLLSSSTIWFNRFDLAIDSQFALSGFTGVCVCVRVRCSVEQTQIKW